MFTRYEWGGLLQHTHIHSTYFRFHATEFRHTLVHCQVAMCERNASIIIIIIIITVATEI